MLKHVVGLAEVEATLLGGELAVANIDPRREVIFGAAQELFEELVEERIIPLIQQHIVRVASSFGKDSTLLLAIMVEGHRRARARGLPVAGPLIVTHGDTRIESPVMHTYAMRQMRLLESYLDREGVDHRLICAEPQDRYSWPVMYCGGLKLLTVGASASADCSIVLKQDPLKRVERELAQEFPGIVTATGVRLDESANRAQSIRELGLDKGLVVIHGSNRDVAPIVDLGTADVWLLLRCMGEGAHREYGNHLPYWDSSTFYLRRMYDDQDESQCPITGSSSLVSKTGCGGSSLRGGCALCTVVNNPPCTPMNAPWRPFARAARYSPAVRTTAKSPGCASRVAQRRSRLRKSVRARHGDRRATFVVTTQVAPVTRASRSRGKSTCRAKAPRSGPSAWRRARSYWKIRCQMNESMWRSRTSLAR